MSNTKLVFAHSINSNSCKLNDAINTKQDEITYYDFLIFADVDVYLHSLFHVLRKLCMHEIRLIEMFYGNGIMVNCYK